MYCTRVQELLPLYAGADLAAREAEAVRAHLETCALCREVAEEFAASAVWLQAAPLPEFDEAFFDDLRAGVWQRQARLAAQPTWFEQWLPSGGWRLVWAATALAVLVMAAVWSWSVYRRGVAPLPNRIDDYAGTTTDKGPTVPTPQDNLPELKPRSANVSALKQQKRHKPQAVEVAPRLPEIVVPPTPRLPEQPNLIAQATWPLSENQGESPNPPEMPEMLRIELQTADPNIRIIWFAPKTETPSNTKPETNSR